MGIDRILESCEAQSFHLWLLRGETTSCNILAIHFRKMTYGTPMASKYLYDFSGAIYISTAFSRPYMKTVFY